jgi:cytochrome b561
MALRNGPEGFGLVTRALHWLTAAGVLAMLGLGLTIARMEASLSNLWLFGLHKTIGLTLLALTLVRIAWHRASPPPPPIAAPRPWQTRLAVATHAGFYALLLVAPLAGWVASAASGLDVVVFGRWTLPKVAPTSPALEAAAFAVHRAATWTFGALVLLHIAGAAARAARGDGTLRRMLRG